MEWLSPLILLVVAVELGFIYLKMGNFENKDAKIFLTPGGSTPNIWVDMKNGHQMKPSTGN